MPSPTSSIFSTLHIDGLHRDDPEASIMLKYVDAPVLRLSERDDHQHRLRPENDPPPSYSSSRSKTQPTGSLWLTIEKYIDAGLHGTVYTSRPTRSSPSSTETPHASTTEGLESLPPLIIKACKRGQGEALIHEKSVYDELHELQGVSIPRCYGLFHGKLETGQRLGDWWSTGSQSVDLGDLDVYVLLLEQLGDPVNVSEPIQPATFTDWWELLEDIHRYSIFHGDLHKSNFLQVLPTPHGLPLERCPHHKHVHMWRITDLSPPVEKVWLTDEAMEEYARDNFDIITENLREGRIVRSF